MAMCDVTDRPPRSPMNSVTSQVMSAPTVIRRSDRRAPSVEPPPPPCALAFQKPAAVLDARMSQQPLRRDRWAVKTRWIKLHKFARQISPCRVRSLAHRPQRMIRPKTRLEISVAEQRFRPLVRSTHQMLPTIPRISESLTSSVCDGDITVLENLVPEAQPDPPRG